MSNIQIVPVKVKNAEFLIPALNIGLGATMGAAAAYFNAEAALAARISDEAVPRLFCAAAAGYGLVNAYLVGLVMKARTETECGHPIAYPCESDVKNKEDRLRMIAAQRAHLNFQEHSIPFLTTVAVAALYAKKPRLAAVGTLVWLAGRLISGHGYASGDPNRRVPGLVLANVPAFMLLGTVMFAAVGKGGDVSAE